MGIDKPRIFEKTCLILIAGLKQEPPYLNCNRILNLLQIIMKSLRQQYIITRFLMGGIICENMTIADTINNKFHRNFYDCQTFK